MREELRRLDPHRLRLEPAGQRKVPATLYLPEQLPVEQDAVRQLGDAASIDDEAVVLATPDLHVGYGVPIGSVFASPRYISPAAVGYDVNCGMRLLTTPLLADEVDVARLAGDIRRDIPLGEGQTNLRVGKRSLHLLVRDGVPALARVAAQEASLSRALRAEDLEQDLPRIEDGGALGGEVAATPERALSRGAGQLATLGGGNHFIELQRVQRVEDEDLASRWGLRPGQLVVMLHSGSRGLGHEVGGHFMRLAARYCDRHGLPLPSADLAYLPLQSPEGRQYMGAMNAAANFAFVNRQLMAGLVRANLRHHFGEDLALPTLYDVPHNIAKLERHGGRELCVHRKGATRAFPGERLAGTPFAATGQPVLIPGSMGTASYLLVGGSAGAESLFSVNHGAGRVMSRKAASGVVKKGRVLRPGLISDQEFAAAMRGVHLLCASRAQIKEEAPQAYKDIDLVIDTVVGAGLARVVARMVPLAVLKG